MAGGRISIRFCDETWTKEEAACEEESQVFWMIIGIIIMAMMTVGVIIWGTPWWFKFAGIGSATLCIAWIHAFLYRPT